MFHLFNYIKIVPDFAIDSIISYGQLCTISKFDDYEHTKNPIYNQLVEARSTFNASSYEELVGEGKTFENDVEFFKAMFEQTKRTNNFDIAADTETYAKLVAKFIKIVLPNCNATQAYAQYKLSLDWFEILYLYIAYGNSVSILGKMRDEKIKRVSEKDFTKMFDALPTVKGQEEFVDTIKEYISVEYQIASVLSGEKEFEARIREILAKRIFYKCVGSCNEFIEQNIYKLYQDNSYDKDINDLIANNETLSYLIDKLDLMSKGVIDKSFKTLVGFLKTKVKSMESTSIDEEINAFINNVSENATPEFLRTLQTAQIQYLDVITSCELLETIEKMTAKDLIEHVIEHSKQWYNVDFAFNKDRMAINLYLLYHIYNTYKSNKDILGMYSLHH